LLAQIPLRCENALEVGCGTGAFTRLLAERAQNVLALDLSPAMIELAQARSSEYANIKFSLADISETDLPAEHFDCIASIATLHHLPLAPTLEKLKRALKPNGVLLINDLFEREGLFDLAAHAVALPVGAARRIIKFGRLRPPRAVREAWNDHGKHDTYPTLTEVGNLRRDVLPNAVIKRHLLWRYSLIWRKPN
jgi:ubiquinone/menaquinone biosynthesis C-methylase UbiE